MPERHGLVPVEQEIFLGFVFVRLEASSDPGVAEMAAPYAHELAAYRFEELIPQGRVTLRPRSVNWKNVADNYSDGLHITVAHPGLTRLFGNGYGIEAQPWIDKMWGQLRDVPSSNWSERMYQRVLPPVPSLPPERQRLWTYFKLWPNVAFDIYPDQVDFMQFVPVSPTRDADSRDRLHTSRQSPGNAHGALPQLAHQPPGEHRRQGAHRARAGGHGVEQLYGGAARRERGLPEELRATDAQRDPTEPVARGAAARWSFATSDTQTLVGAQSAWLMHA